MAGTGDFAALLALDGLARRQGAGGLHPRLRQAVEEDGRWRAHSAGPAVGLRGERPADAVPLRPADRSERRRA